MLTERFGSEALGLQTPNPPSHEECVALRQEEALALNAIYGDRFCERIPDSVWTIELDLMWMETGTSSQSNPRRGQAGSSSAQVCRFYLKGSCRFGSRCKYKHQSQNKSSHDPSGPSQPGFSSSDPPVYLLEVRFPSGSCYPYQPPLAAFSTTDGKMTGAGRLNVTEHLFSLALSAAETGEPVIYSLISCLEEDGQIKELLSASHHKYSVRPPVLAPPTSTATRTPGNKSTASNITSNSLNSVSRPNNTQPYSPSPTVNHKEGNL